jgi:hypothetical protein
MMMRETSAAIGRDSGRFESQILIAFQQPYRPDKCLKAVDSMGSNHKEPALERAMPSFSISRPPAMLRSPTAICLDAIEVLALLLTDG